MFDDPNLVLSAGLIPVLALARSAGLHELAQRRLTVPSDKGANAGFEVASLDERPPREQTAHVPDHCATRDRR